MEVRLINADELKQSVKSEMLKAELNSPVYLTLECVVADIENQPTAYDVDKVVHHLKSGKFTEQETTLSDTHQGFNAGVEFSIKVVKAGGANG